MLNMTGLLLHPHSTFKGKHTLKITEMGMKQGRRGTGACCFSYILVEQLSYPLTAVLLCRECVPWECPCSIGYYIYIYIYIWIFCLMHLLYLVCMAILSMSWSSICVGFIVTCQWITSLLIFVFRLVGFVTSIFRLYTMGY